MFYALDSFYAESDEAHSFIEKTGEAKYDRFIIVANV